MNSDWVTRFLSAAARTFGGTPAPGATYTERRVESWGELRDIFEGPEYRSWAFRGQPDASWKLETSLSRYLTRAKVRDECRRLQEERILRIFRRKAHLHLSNIPDERDALEWLALMQHHGAPTRLLDFTWSRYVAAFYALSEPPQAPEAAIWAINPGALQANNKRFGPWTYGNFERYFLPSKKSIVVLGEPHHMNRRLIAHSGTFVMPGRLDISVDEIITRYIDASALVKIIFSPAKIRRDAIKALYNMNITHATLFPDLDGLARSMGLELELHWQFDPVSSD